MARRVPVDADALTPADRRGATSEAVFFPSEVARLLGLEGIDYDTLRRLFKLSRTTRGLDDPTAGSGENKWARFTLSDLACTEALVQVGGGREALRSGKRLLLGEVEQACKELLNAGASNPLLEVPMTRVGRTRIVAYLDGYLFEPASGQVVFSDVLEQLRWLSHPPDISDGDVRGQVRRLRRSHRPNRQQRRDYLKRLRVVG